MSVDCGWNMPPSPPPKKSINTFKNTFQFAFKWQRPLVAVGLLALSAEKRK